MSLNNIQLGSYITQQLYTKTLVDLSENTKQEAKVKGPEIAHLGSNEKLILILVSDPDTIYADDADLALLTGILNACNISLADVAIVNVAKTPCDFPTLVDAFTPGFVFLLGTTPASLDFPMNFPDFQLQNYNHQTYLPAPSLKVLAQNTYAKKQLWACLQKHFHNS